MRCVEFNRPQKFESRNIGPHLLFLLNGEFRNKHVTRVNVSITLPLVCKDDCLKLHIKSYNAY
jgi:hypothetical protein